MTARSIPKARRAAPMLAALALACAAAVADNGGRADPMHAAMAPRVYSARRTGRGAAIRAPTPSKGDLDAALAKLNKAG